ncbi:MAG: glycoside hydrolase family 2 TIM barrel-domain containing protein [Bacteroidota bacterium]
MRSYLPFVLLLLFAAITNSTIAQSGARVHQSFNSSWKFYLGNAEDAEKPSFDDDTWRNIDLPHDWSIELPFDKDSPTGTGGGALRGGTGWYRKTFSLPNSVKGKYIAITFDGIYRNSEVWLNGLLVGKRPNGYISFQYDLSPYLKFGNAKNVIVVKADNSQQPNSRWYSGSGIYRNVWLTITDKLHIAYNGTYITTPEVSKQSATVNLALTIEVPLDKRGISASTILYTKEGKQAAKLVSPVPSLQDTPVTVAQKFMLSNPVLWSVDNPYLYKAVTQLISNGRVVDEYTTYFGIRSFVFDIDKGFLLNGQHVKIRGVCNHHDLGCLGTAINKSALQRQLQLLKDMGCNGIRTSHNPPAPELLDLCDEMGFIVMDEAFDMWKKQKSKYDYHLDWDQWHRKDLVDQIERDRNHPSVFIWSVGNELQEQWGKDDDVSGSTILKELVEIVKETDPTRPTVTANNEVNKWSRLLSANSADMIGYNYNHRIWDSVFYRWGRKPFIVTESVSSLTTRGHYDMPSDSIRRWPLSWDKPVENANPDLTCSAYDNCSAPWGSTHEETMKVFEKYDHISGMYIWTGFDYLGEPTPYPWPARSSYFGIIDLAGFPKDVYYMYQSIWTDKPVLHILPHWNWKEGQTIDVWAYYNNADEVELFLNGQSLGAKRKSGDDLHVMWRLPFKTGVLKAVSRRNGKIVLTKEIKTAGSPAKIILESNKKIISSKNNDLDFVTVKVVDKDGNLVPDADNLVHFSVDGGTIAGVDNGSQTSMESFKDNKRKAFNGLCLTVVKPTDKNGVITFRATSEGLKTAAISITVK